MTVADNATPRSPLPTLGELPAPAKALCSAFLVTIGFGYITALFFLYSADIRPHVTMGMSGVQGLEMKYYGDRGTTVLEAALRGVMADRVAPAQRDEIIQWIHDGATAKGFEKVKPIFVTVCAGCHSPKSGMPLPPLTDYQQVRRLAQVDTGESLMGLARVSHIHLFGISLIFLLTGSIFSLSRLGATWKVWILVLPYVSIWADIGSWWLAKFDPVFAYVVLTGGALMGVSLALQIFIPLWEMWVRTSSEVGSGSHPPARNEVNP